ncbi:MAG: V-type ATP synthase subunit D, partial [Lentisphaeria bacterium]|nr:V-type ATP synthase subunit D [Lentisphaeria bacterium]
LEIRLCAERIAANERKEQEAVARLAEWTMLFGDADAAAVIAAKLRIRKVNREYENIAGVNVPVYHSTDFELEPYDLFSADPWIDDGIEAVKAIVELRIERDIIREQNRLIVQELRVTTQRVNLFEKVKIPEAKENIRLIQISISDNDIAAVARSKIAKKKLQEPAA